MTPAPDRDAALDRILRRFAIPAEAPSEDTPLSGDCLDAETIAAMADGGLSASEQTAAAEHALTCPRCRELIASVVRTTPELAVQPAGWRSWWHLPSIRWLAPAVATGLAVAVWVAVDSRPSNVVSLPVPLAVPEKRAPAAVPSTQKDEAKADAAPAPAPRALADSPAEPPKQEIAQEKRTAGDQDKRRDALAGRAPAAQRARSKPEPVDQLAAAKATQKLNEEMLHLLEKRAADAAAPAVAAPPPPISRALNESAGRGGGQAGGAANLPRTEAFADRAVVGGLAESVTVAMPDIASPDPRSRWRISGSSVQRSTDNGQTWTGQETGTSVRLTAGSAPHADICWIVGDQGTVLVSVDGRSWQRVKSPDPMRLVSVTATSADAATVTTSDGRTFITKDRGQTWEAK